MLLAAASWAAFALWSMRPFSPPLWWLVWQLGAATTIAAAAVAIARRSLLPLVLAQGVATWVVLCSASFVWQGERAYVVTAALAGAAVLTSVRGLRTATARAEFGPVAYRSVFLLGAVLAAAMGVGGALGLLSDAIFALGGHPRSAPGAVWGPGLVAAGYLLSAVGVVRMRAWGVILGAATAAGSALCALPVLHAVRMIDLALVCIPGAVLAGPLVLTRLGKGDVAVPTHARLRLERRDPERAPDLRGPLCDAGAYGDEAWGETDSLERRA
jgi:hypothetical protein